METIWSERICVVKDLASIQEQVGVLTNLVHSDGHTDTNKQSGDVKIWFVQINMDDALKVMLSL